MVGRERAMPGATGRRCATDFANVWTIRNGRTGEGQVFADTAALAAVPGESTRKL